MAVANLSSIQSIKITHGRTNETWTIIDDNNNSNGYFEQITFDEGLEQTVPSGILLLRDPYGDVLKNFNFSGKDTLQIIINSPDPNNPTTTIQTILWFIIYQASQATDFADRSQPKLVSLKFIDQIYFYNQRRPFVYEEDAKLVSEWAKDIIVRFSNLPLAGGETDSRPYFISESKNYAWLKEKQQICPSGRKVDNDSFLNLLNYLASNAVDSNNVPNFFFWKDLSSTNFISFEAMQNLTTNPIAMVLSTTTIDAIGPNGEIKINSIDSIPNFSFMELENNGAFCSYYERIDPDFENPYFSFSDLSKGYTKYPVTYSLDSSFKKGGKLFSPYQSRANIADGINIPMDPFDPADGIAQDFFPVAGATLINITPKRMYDDGQWGYFDTTYNNSDMPEPTFSLYTEQGITGKYDKTNRLSSAAWQTMFDIDELDPILGVTLQFESEVKEDNPQGNSYQKINYIQKFIEIKKGISAARKEYYELRELKERWNIFKYVVCCINDISDSFYAIILGATALDGSNDVIIDPVPSKAKAFKYAWKEIQFLPKEYQGISGSNIVSIFPEFGASGSSEGCTCGIPTGLSLSAGITGITFSWAHPFFEVMLPNDARSGGFTGFTAGFTADEFIPVNTYPYFAAFNINEFANYEISETGLRRKYSGPGINMQLETFPQGNKIIPVGYMPSYDDPCKHQFHGQIVKMYQIPLKGIKGISLSQEDLKAAPIIYVFDVQNAIEGQCEECEGEA
jgi:hypothetical protein